ncbi:carboxylate-amine ligase [Yinghuangia aomiensis]|uniref:carboxylate-amine ligase n=1 Tax=Yinghuangia aomiensis TaxID=676205 RepID=UPI0031E5BC11
MTTVGVEEEFHIVDLKMRDLAPFGPRILERLPGSAFSAEAMKAMIESRTLPHTEMAALQQDLVTARTTLAAAAAEEGCGVIASGTAPLMRVEDPVRADGSRYMRIEHTYAKLFHELQVCGLHVHVGVEDRDLAARALAWINPWVPALTALTAGSPYWLGQETGYASWRTLVLNRLPSAGPAPYFASADEYDLTADALVRSGTILDRRMLYYDVRLSAHLPTLELRACDAVPDVSTAVMIAALFRALVVHACRRASTGERPPDIPGPWLRAASWRAARSGLEGTLVDPFTMVAGSAHAMVEGLIGTVGVELAEFGDLDRVRAVSDALLAAGSSARRQRTIGRRLGLTTLVEALMATTKGQRTSAFSAEPKPLG